MRGEAKEDANLNLVRKMGAPSYDPMPTDQYGCFADPEFTISQRAHRMLAQIRLDCLELKPGGRTPFAAPPGHRGGKRFLLLKDIGSKLDWDPSATIRVSNELVNVGLIRVDDQGRVWLCGKVDKQWRINSEQIQDGGEDQEWEKFCTDNFPAYMSLKLKQVPKNDRDSVRADAEAWSGFEKRACAEAMKATRDQVQSQRDKHFAERYGVTVRRFERKLKDDQKPKLEPLVKLSVQNFSALFVQSEKPGLYTPTNGSVQRGSNSKVSEVFKGTEHACMHALSDLRSYFPDEFIPEEAIRSLDEYLFGSLGEYDRNAFLDFVAVRRRKGQISPGLVFDLNKGLAVDFCKWAQQLRAQKNNRQRQAPVTEEVSIEQQIQTIEALLIEAPHRPDADLLRAELSTLHGSDRAQAQRAERG